MTTKTDEQPTAPVIVAVIGDSLTLPRQFQDVEFHHTYPNLLAYWLRQQGCPAEVWEATEAGAPIAKLFGEYRTYVGKHRSGVGVVDCPPRLVPLWLRRAIIGKLPGFLRSPINQVLAQLPRATSTLRAWVCVYKAKKVRADLPAAAESDDGGLRPRLCN